MQQRPLNDPNALSSLPSGEGSTAAAQQPQQPVVNNTKSRPSAAAAPKVSIPSSDVVGQPAAAAAADSTTSSSQPLSNDEAGSAAQHRAPTPPRPILPPSPSDQPHAAPLQKRSSAKNGASIGLRSPPCEPAVPSSRRVQHHHHQHAVAAASSSAAPQQDAPFASPGLAHAPTSPLAEDLCTSSYLPLRHHAVSAAQQLLDRWRQPGEFDYTPESSPSTPTGPPPSQLPSAAPLLPPSAYAELVQQHPHSGKNISNSNNGNHHHKSSFGSPAPSSVSPKDPNRPTPPPHQSVGTEFSYGSPQLPPYSNPSKRRSGGA